MSILKPHFPFLNNLSTHMHMPEKPGQYLYVLAEAVAFLFILILLFTTMAPNARAAEVRIITEDWAPFNFVDESGTVTGVGTEIVNELIARTMPGMKVEVLPWKRAFNLASTKPRVGLFSLSRTPVREDNFRWVGPLFSVRDYLFVLADNDVELNNVADLRDMGTLSIQAGNSTHQVFKSLNKEDVLELHNIGKMPEMLLTKRVSAVLLSDFTMSYELKKRGIAVSAVRPATMFGVAHLYLGFSADTPDAFITRWQIAFSDMEADGTLAKIRSRWAPDSSIWNADFLNGLEAFGYSGS